MYTTLEFLEDSVELWYDGMPSAYIQIKLFNSIKVWTESGIPEKMKLKFYELILQIITKSASNLKYRYTGDFFRHSIASRPSKLVFKNDSPLVHQIKKDKAYTRILSILKERVKNRLLNGEVILGNERDGLNVNFKNWDLEFSLHGLKKIYYTAHKKPNGDHDFKFTLYYRYYQIN